MKVQLKLAALLMLATALSITACGGSGDSVVVGGTPVTFSGVTQTGGASGTANTTALTLTFSVDPTTLAASNITVTGATKGTLSGSGTTRTLAISDITVANGATVSVAVTSPAGFTITGSPKTVVVYCNIAIGQPYLGGKIAYILESGDPGYDAAVQHGLIAAIADQSTGIIWALPAYQSTAVPAPDTAIGTGLANTNAIVSQNDPSDTGLITYAAGLAREYNGGGYTDWYLPSKDELNKLYLNRVVVGGFAVNFYWSSSETNAYYAWYQNFGSGYQGLSSKYYAYYVRAVRAF